MQVDEIESLKAAALTVQREHEATRTVQSAQSEGFPSHHDTCTLVKTVSLRGLIKRAEQLDVDDNQLEQAVQASDAPRAVMELINVHEQQKRNVKAPEGYKVGDLLRATMAGDLKTVQRWLECANCARCMQNCCCAFATLAPTQDY